MELEFDLDTSSIGQLPAKYAQAKARTVSESAQLMVRFLMQNSPKDQGLLRQWFIESLNEEEAVIKSSAKYAIYQDQGTQSHMIKPVEKKALFWIQDGEKCFSKGHMVRGIEGKHFVQQSFDQLQPLVPGLFLRALEEAR